MSELAKAPEARAKIAQVRIRLADAKRRREATLACVDPTYRRCRYCKQFGDPEKMIRSHKVRRPRVAIRFAHRACSAEYFREYRRKKH
jgi:hypothetical protein